MQLFTWQTPNGRKISIMLEELGLGYELRPINILKDEQFSPDFLAKNPNNKIPVIVDPDGPGGEELVLFESGAILVYLAQKYRSELLPSDPRAQAITLQWLMFQMGGVGPMLGQLHHFRRYAQDQEYSLGRYQKEVERIYGVLNKRLQDSAYIAGDGYTIADIATYPWLARNPLHNIDLEKVPNLKRWYDHVGARPAVQRGMNIPEAG
ncbi:glutathione S-transferase [Sphingobium cupriresistens LL01]|uniref:Glutathione S-transferase n=1 Tax=Sphingobium cupriresistens LL01 TaxID=1420583 RepID=A0A0J7XFZ9_9SPHN|nr:glutathione S-transferase [Sphingobium cupriresistens LL01]